MKNVKRNICMFMRKDMNTVGVSGVITLLLLFWGIATGLPSQFAVRYSLLSWLPLILFWGYAKFIWKDPLKKELSRAKEHWLRAVERNGWFYDIDTMLAILEKNSLTLKELELKAEDVEGQLRHYWMHEKPIINTTEEGFQHDWKRFCRKYPKTLGATLS